MGLRSLNPKHGGPGPTGLAEFTGGHPGAEFAPVGGEGGKTLVRFSFPVLFRYRVGRGTTRGSSQPQPRGTHSLAVNQTTGLPPGRFP